MGNNSNTKQKLIKAKVTRQMKREVEQLARKRDESEALLVREALRRYIAWAKRSGLLAIAATTLPVLPR